jgi:hypothetical protein
VNHRRSKLDKNVAAIFRSSKTFGSKGDGSMPRICKRVKSNALTRAKFPMIFENEKPEAVVIDVEKSRLRGK